MKAQLGTKEFNDSAMEMFGGKPKQETAVEWFANAIKGLDTSVSYYFFQEMLEQAKEMEKQQGYSEEEVLNFTQTMLMQYKFGNTNIEQIDLLRETFQLFKNK